MTGNTVNIAMIPEPSKKEGLDIFRKIPVPILSILVVFLFLLIIALDYIYYSNRFYPGMFIENVYVGNKHCNEVASLLEKRFDGLKSKEIIFLHDQIEPLSISCSDAGISASVDDTLQKGMATGRFRLFGNILVGNPIARVSLLIHKHQVRKEVKLEEELFSEMMKNLATRYMISPQNAYFVTRNDHLEIYPEKRGSYLKIAATRNKIIRAVERCDKYKSSASSIEIRPLTGVWPAAITTVDMERMGIKEKISSFSTAIGPGNVNRTHNIVLACSMLEGYILAPGEMFSFNKVIGAASYSDGFREAPIISNGKLVPGVGGGLCQVSSTLYNSALLANLKIVERHGHSLPVGYVELGRDATIAYDYLDLKFENTLDSHIMIDTEVKNGRLIVRLYGQKNGTGIRITSTDKVRIAPPIVLEDDRCMKPGEIEMIKKGSPGYRISTWRLFLEEEVEIGREKLSDDYYRPEPFIYRAAP
ncbi:MAG: hypothetical protein GX887_01490 [Firmicutes bacterium]|nr:hypothetical protein [Bacillota bacterium]